MCYNIKEDDMKKYGFCLLVIMILLMPTSAKAIICSNQDKVRLQKLANNIATSYSYTEENHNVVFQIKLSNIHPDLVIVDYKTNVRYGYQGGELTISNISPNTQYRFDVYTDKYFCHHELLYTHYVNLPAYNPYYDDPICVGKENNPLCQKWNAMNLSYDELKLELQTKEEIQEVKTENKQIKGFYDYLSEFYLKYYYVILPLIIGVGIGGIYYYNRKNDLF